MNEEQTPNNNEQQRDPEADQPTMDLFSPQPESGSWDFSSMEVPEELAGYTPPPATMPAPTQLPPALDRPRPAREPIISTSAWVAAGIALLVVVLSVAVWFATASSQEVTIPGVVGKQQSAAALQLSKLGLKIHVTEKRFSPKPVGEVIEQHPLAGSKAGKGDVVSVVISAGTEEAQVPDVVGSQLDLAKSTLEKAGFLVVLERVESTAVSGTVLAQMPAPGVVARSGDVVRLQVAAPAATVPGTRPYGMQGLTIVIDPAPVAAGQSDVPLEVGRRLQSLLEASGAQVTVLRSGTSSSTADSARSSALRPLTPTVAVGLSSNASGAGGRVVQTPSASPSIAMSDLLGGALNSQLTTAAPPSKVTSVGSDPVLSATSAPWARVVLGSYADPGDVSAFGDPTWADRVARAIYTAIGEVFGHKE